MTAVLDERLRIVRVNLEWRTRARGAGDATPGTDFLGHCREAWSLEPDLLAQLADGLRAVASARSTRFDLRFATNLPIDEHRRFDTIAGQSRTDGGEPRTPTGLSARAHPAGAGIVVTLETHTDTVVTGSVEPSPAADDETLAGMLASARARLDVVETVASVGSWQTDIATLQVAWSDELHRIFGTDPSQFTPTHQSFLDFVHPDDRAAVDAAFSASLATREICRIEHRIVLAGDRQKIVEERWRTGTAPDGRLVAQGTCRDVTTERLAAAALRASEERFRSIFRDAATGIAISDVAGRLIEANVAYQRMLGFSEAELRQYDFLSLTHPGDRAANAALIDELLRGVRDSFVIEKRYLHKTGRDVWARLSVSAQRDRDGAALSIIGIAEDITQQRVAEDALRQSLVLQRIGGRVGRVGGWAADPLRNSTFWSDEVFTIIEWPDRKQPTLDAALSLYLPVHRQRIESAVSRCLERGTAFDIEAEMHTAKGRPIWVRVAGEAERDASGTVSRVVGAFQDISDIKRAQTEHLRLTQRLGATLESMSDAFYLLDRDWNIAFMNSEAEQVMGVDRAGLIGRNFWTLFPHTTGTAIDREYHAAVSDGVARRFEFYSEWIEQWLEISAHPSVDGLAVYFRVTTERKQLHTRLAQSEERLRLVARAALDTVWDWSLQQDTVWWNDGLRQHFGHDPGTAAVTPASFRLDCVHPDDRARVEASLRRVLESTREDWQQQYRFRRADGRYATVVDRGFVIRDADGRAVRMVGGLSDVSERIAIEEHLRQAQRLESIGQLTGGIAHDFNNLLTVILGNSELVTELLADRPDVQPIAEMIREAAQRGADLTRRLLAFARRQALEPQAVDVDRLIDGFLGLLKRTLGERIEIRIVADAGNRRAIVDPTQLESALLNLAINARDAMPNGGSLTITTGHLSVTAAPTSPEHGLAAGQYLTITVADTGSGMPPEVAERAFEPFFTTKAQGKGTGLGLSMVYGFAKQSQGLAELETSPGSGTTVRLYLPAADAGAEPPNGDEVDKGDDGAGTILLVEDDDMVRAFASAQIRSLGYRVLEACNGRQALDRLESGEHVDLLFTDIVMPGDLGGRELAEAAVALRPDLPVLFTSGYTDGKLADDSGGHPLGPLLSKPYRRNELARRLREALSPRKT